jgi:hypothetical protein
VQQGIELPGGFEIFNPAEGGGAVAGVLNDLQIAAGGFRTV